MKRISRILISVILLVALCTASLTALASSYYYGKVNGSKVNLWPKASDHAPKDSRICTLGSGTRVLFSKSKYGSSGSYCKVITEYGKTGYVYYGYLSKSGSCDSGKIYKGKKDTPMYKKAGSGKCDYLHKGQRVILVSKSGDWAKVKKLNGSVMYVKKSYLTKA